MGAGLGFFQCVLSITLHLPLLLFLTGIGRPGASCTVRSVSRMWLHVGGAVATEPQNLAVPPRPDRTPSSSAQPPRYNPRMDFKYILCFQIMSKLLPLLR